MDTGIHVGNTVEKGEIDAVANAILRILEAKSEQKTIRKALDVFHKMTEVKNITISGCTISD